MNPRRRNGAVVIRGSSTHRRTQYAICEGDVSYSKWFKQHERLQTVANCSGLIAGLTFALKSEGGCLENDFRARF
jgi:hypothetical protein